MFVFRFYASVNSLIDGKMFVFNGILFVLEWRKLFSPRFCLGFVTGTAVGII